MIKDGKDVSDTAFIVTTPSKRKTRVPHNETPSKKKKV